MDIDTRFEEMGGKAMAQRLEACAVLEVGRLLGVGGDPLRGPDGHRCGGVSTRKQPAWRPVQPPRGSQCGQQARRKERGALLTPLALSDAHQHAVTCEVRQLQMDDLTDPQASGVGGHEQGAVLGVLYAGA